ncbi:MAG: MarR family transcriptional regulator [Bifidobacteriaceae bacterium]|jgi:DNA-binding MarR family transcriptional regulator|nr:MarR family transcriptional regulator [Bifidobacteriaceae bacterium]MCI1978673.1 MarR family transcriptional regulator [Bifidobacteriaceae bacterium]
MTDRNNAEIEDLAEEFLRMMPRLHRTGPQRRINRSMRGEHFIIQYINMEGRKIQPSEISNEMRISSARVAAALNSLEKKGLIVREIDPSDRRRILVNLTSEGKKTAQAVSRQMVEGVYSLFSKLGIEDSREFLVIMRKIASVMESWHPDFDERAVCAHETTDETAAGDESAAESDAATDEVNASTDESVTSQKS